MNTHSKKLALIALVAGALAIGGSAGAQRPSGARITPSPSWGDNGDLHTFHVQGHVYLLVGAGGNIAVQIGDDGVLVVDTGLPQHADKVLAAIRTLSDGPIRTIINTHVHADHAGGNEIIGEAGSTTQGEPTRIIAHENVLNRMVADETPLVTWPTSTYVPEEKDIFFNDEPIMMYHDAAGHTDGDTIVLFRRSDVIMAGDVYVTTGYPVIDFATGGGVQGIIDGLNRILDLAVPKHEQEGGTFVIPGHGRISDEADVLEYRDMVTIVRDRIRNMVDRGLTLDQVHAARPTLDYDRHYGSDSGPWTTGMFVEAIYRDLSRTGSGQ